MLGVPIVRRGNKFLGFTKDGELLLTWANKILAQAEGLRQDMQIAQGELRGTLVLGVVPTALSYAASISTTLRKSNPGLSIHIRSLSSQQIARALGEFSIDAGITYESDNKNDATQFEVVYEENYVLVAPKLLSPRKSGSATWAEASALPLCLLSKDMHFRHIVDDVFDMAGVTARPVLETNSFTAALAQVANGSAATIAPTYLAESLLLDDSIIKLTLCDPVVSHPIGLSVIVHEPMLPAIAALQAVTHPDHN